MPQSSVPLRPAPAGAGCRPRPRSLLADDRHRPDHALRRHRRHPAQRLGAGRSQARAGHRHALHRRGHPAADANAAMRANAEQMAKVVAAIKAAGIADKDVQTSGISLNPHLPVRREPAADDHRLRGPQHGQRRRARHRQARQDPRHAGVGGRQPDQRPQLRCRQEGRGQGRSPPRRDREGPGPRRDVRQDAGHEGAPHRQHQRRRRLRPADADDAR